MPQGFGKDRRLGNSAEFDQVFKGNEIRVSRQGIVMLATRNQRNVARLGMVISKRSLRLSVHRSRLKRLIRECFRREERLEGLDIVVMSRAGVRIDQASSILSGLTSQLLARRAKLEAI